MPIDLDSYGNNAMALDENGKVMIKVAAQLTGSIQSATITADNLAATITLAVPPVGQAHYLHGISAGFSAAATKLLTVKDGVATKENIIVVNSYNEGRVKPLKITDATALEVSLAASGTLGNIGYLTVRYETR